MRETKFRGRHLRLPGLYDKWVYGSLYSDGVYDNEPMIIERVTDEHYPVAPETVGQYAGREDSQGKEIFEGDIVDRPVGFVNINGKWQSFAFRGVVYWDAEECAFMAQGKGVKTRLKKTDTVIGNIYDNPNLMEAK